MRVKTVPSDWIRREGRRMDCNPYMSGALEMKVLLEGLPVRKDSLRSLTGGMSGLVNPGRIKRIWVDGAEFGRPFLSSTDILQADLSRLRFISDRAVAENPKLVIREGWTLITRAGTIGRMAYAREDMDGMACTEDVLRVIPASGAVPPGYLYAYLSSKFGVPLVVSGTYGAIIQHIEPHHVADLPVPRLGDAVELAAHKCIQEASAGRADAARIRAEVLSSVTRRLGWAARTSASRWTAVNASCLRRRMDSFHHADGVAAARECLGKNSSARLGDVVEEVFEPNRGARRKVEDPAYGLPFLSSSQVFRLDPVGEYYISKSRTPHLERQVIRDVDLLLPRSGQLGGIIGRAVLPLPTCYGSAASEHLVRVRCRSREDAYLAWALLATEPGYYAAIGTAFGSSIPSLDCALLGDLRVPWWTGAIRAEIVDGVARMVALLADAIDAEREGVALVERAIEEAS